LVRADFPKAKICQKNSPKYWRGPKKSVKSQKSHFWIDFDKYYPIPPKKIKIIYILLLQKNSYYDPNLEADLQRNAAISCNITGLQNSSSLSTVLPVTSFSQGNQAVTEEDDALMARPVRNKKDEACSEAEDSGEETDEEDYAESEWDELDDQDFAERLAEMAIADDPNDLDWVPPSLLHSKKGKKSYMYSQVLIKN
jgi:hypothetical protein